MREVKRRILFLYWKATVLLLSISNGIYIWFHQNLPSEGTVSLCYSCAWYDTWSYTNIPSMLVLAALLSLIGRWWSYLLGSVMAGSIVIYMAVHLARTLVNFGVQDTLNGLINSEPSILLIWETQLIWATIISILPLYYFLSERRGANSFRIG